MAKRTRLSYDQREIFTRFREAGEAEPKGELDHVNAYTLVVAVALERAGHRCGASTRPRKALFQIADTPQKMLDLGLDGLTEHIKTIGLFRQKAKNVMKLSQILVDDHGGEVPSSRAALQSLPGVGPQDRQCGPEHVVSNTPPRRSIPISSASATAPGSRPARMWTPLKRARSKTTSRRNFSNTPITG